MLIHSTLFHRFSKKQGMEGWDMTTVGKIYSATFIHYNLTGEKVGARPVFPRGAIGQDVENVCVCVLRCIVAAYR